MMRRPPRSTLFPYTTSSDLSDHSYDGYPHFNADDYADDYDYDNNKIGRAHV